MRAVYTEVLRNLVFRSIQKETRLSEAQVARLRWCQIKGNTIRTTRNRDCKVSREVVDALSLLPHRETGVDYVFFGNSLSKSDLDEVRTFEQVKNQPKRRFFIYRTKRVA